MGGLIVKLLRFVLKSVLGKVDVIINKIIDFGGKEWLLRSKFWKR